MQEKLKFHEDISRNSKWQVRNKDSYNDLTSDALKFVPKTVVKQY